MDETRVGARGAGELLPMVRGTRGVVLQLLRGRELTVDELAAGLGVTPNAARFRLVELERSGQVTRRAVRRGPRKPSNGYMLTDRGEALLHPGYARCVGGRVALGYRLANGPRGCCRRTALVRPGADSNGHGGHPGGPGAAGVPQSPEEVERTGTVGSSAPARSNSVQCDRPPAPGPMPRPGQPRGDAEPALDLVRQSGCETADEDAAPHARSTRAGRELTVRAAGSRPARPAAMSARMTRP
jgi:hypothetical protein